MGNECDPQATRLRSVLLLFNIQKAGNFGKLIRTANALGIFEVCIVGRRDFATHGHHHTKIATEFRHFTGQKMRSIITASRRLIWLRWKLVRRRLTLIAINLRAIRCFNG